MTYLPLAARVCLSLIFIKAAKGQNVTWAWGNRQAEGKVQEIHHSSITRKIKGNEVTRNGSENNPALVN
ncbi:hypothetical protein C1752_02888 [Acaryochloris thomasi RCC1774]|uniref:Hypervirulence associated protein TUDOR domain-containing protein n=1 Tax=Acaryochloris thomasi RCC1774 TaxID=1764569 RepID=A0A2W1JXZ9_9CYAN|nr:DUF2945 domain-containing protein [Acaryochloris thomasi]PZD73127.1 hypothetical protein C1752_02888 [Acaryochloris thomasi RCC1774]